MNKFTKRILRIVGIDVDTEVFTNRDAFMAELDEMTSKKFMHTINTVDLGEVICKPICVQCKAAHGGLCKPDEGCDDHAPSKWLQREWDGTIFFPKEETTND